MDTREAIEHIRARLDRMENTYRDTWPKWTVADFIAAGILLREADNAAPQPPPTDTED